MDIFTEDHLLFCKRGTERERKRERGGQKQRDGQMGGDVGVEERVCEV